MAGFPAVPYYDCRLLVRFQCNICGRKNEAPQSDLTRETPTCRRCHSSVRYRSLIHQLSLAMFGQPLPLPDFPVRKEIFGLGTSDWHGFANRLRKKFSYQNTFYDVEPRMDLKRIPPQCRGRYDFVICSEVLEHVTPPVQCAFDGLATLLKSGGTALITVPYQVDRATVEHYPTLHEWGICRIGGDRVVVNRTPQGAYEVFERAEFHQGLGETLEMRIFGEQDLHRHLLDAGFDAHFVREPFPEFGIYWAVPWSLPVRARKRAGAFSAESS